MAVLPARSGPRLRADGALGRVVGAELPGTLQHRPCGWVPSGLWRAGYREGEGADLISAFQVFSVALSFLKKYLECFQRCQTSRVGRGGPGPTDPGDS